ncbi:hypothetical protein KM043_010202 [Ampulex compressa]|nr:hypothetical protein KM043_010202 [Ampulex compressa]
MELDPMVNKYTHQLLCKVCPEKPGKKNDTAVQRHRMTKYRSYRDLDGDGSKSNREQLSSKARLAFLATRSSVSRLARHARGTKYTSTFRFAQPAGFFSINAKDRPRIELSNENSCASSNCSSPKGDGKRSTRSVSRLSTLSQGEQQALASARKHPRGSRTDSPPQEDACSIAENQSAEGNVCRYQERSASLEDVERPRLSEPSFLLSREVLQGAVSSAPRRLSDTPSVRNRKKNNASDPTRAFFESMAMTVSTFPQHIQATIKLQICNLVEETEYGLSIPKPC